MILPLAPSATTCRYALPAFPPRTRRSVSATQVAPWAARAASIFLFVLFPTVINRLPVVRAALRALEASVWGGPRAR